MIAFLKVFSVVPGFVWAIMLSGVIAAYAITGHQLRTERAAHTQTKLVHAQQVAAAETARANQEAKYRETEQELIHATEVHAKEIAAVHAARTADRAADAAVFFRLRDASRETAKLAGQVCTDSTTSRVREAVADAARMLADLREESDQRSGILARTADDAHFAGAACERRYAEAREALAR